MEVDYKRVSDSDGEMTLSFTDCKELTVSSSISRTAAISSIRRRFRLHNTDRATRLIMMRRR